MKIYILTFLLVLFSNSVFANKQNSCIKLWIQEPQLTIDLSPIYIDAQKPLVEQMEFIIDYLIREISPIVVEEFSSFWTPQFLQNNIFEIEPFHISCMSGILYSYFREQRTSSVYQAVQHLWIESIIAYSKVYGSIKATEYFLPNKTAAITESILSEDSTRLDLDILDINDEAFKKELDKTVIQVIDHMLPKLIPLIISKLIPLLNEKIDGN